MVIDSAIWDQVKGSSHCPIQLKLKVANTKKRFPQIVEKTKEDKEVEKELKAAEKPKEDGDGGDFFASAETLIEKAAKPVKTAEAAKDKKGKEPVRKSSRIAKRKSRSPSKSPIK